MLKAPRLTSRALGDLGPSPGPGPVTHKRRRPSPVPARQPRPPGAVPSGVVDSDRDRCEAGLARPRVRDQAAAGPGDDRPGPRLGLPFAWFTADETYGDNGKLRARLGKESIAYVVAVARDTMIPGGAGRAIRADALAPRIPARG